MRRRIDMKRKLTVTVTALLLVLQMFCGNLTAVYGLEKTDIFSNEALVIDTETGDILFHKDTESGSVQIASLTKVMTYVLAVENITDLDTKITVPAGTEAEMTAEGASRAWLKDGYEYSALDLLYGLMLPSGCDAADVLAKHIGGGDYYAFIDMMNAKAAALGMDDTVFYSASGLEKDGKNNLSTEQDLYKLAKYAFDKPYFKEIIGTEFYTIIGEDEEYTSQSTVQNTNYMMGEYNGGEYYYIYSLGGKTGYKDAAGRCLISFAKKGDLEVMAITLGVPGNSSNYHLTDHRKLFDYVFEEFTENITVDIGTEYKCVDIGEKIRITPETSAETEVTWKSSDESVATVNENGIVTGNKLGQAKITATTETGNKDYAYVSVGFYNAVDINYHSAPKDANNNKCGELDWKIVKDSGVDMAVVRAGYGLGGFNEDPTFDWNMKGAFENDVDVMISFDGYAVNKSQAVSEAEALLNCLDDSISEYKEEIKLPIVYNLYTTSASDPDLLTDILFAFDAKMDEAGYDTMVELGKTKLSAMDLEKITEKGIDLYMIYLPWVPDYKTRMSAVNSGTEYNADMWQYRSDAYLGAGDINKKIKMSAVYMDYTDLEEDHGNYDDSLYPEKPEIKVEGEYTYTGEDIEAEVSGFDPATMEIEGNVAKAAGTYTVTVTPKENWKDGSKTAVTTTWEIKKADPVFEEPTIEEVKLGTKLSEIELPENFSWKDPEEVVSDDKDTYIAIYVPNDADNYNSVEVEMVIGILIEGSDLEDDDDLMDEGDIIEDKPDDEEKTADPDAVDTGDDMNILGWVAVMMLSLVLMVTVVCRRKSC